MAVAVRLNDKVKDVRRAAAEALGKRVALLDGMLIAVATRLDDENGGMQLQIVLCTGENRFLYFSLDLENTAVGAFSAIETRVGGRLPDLSDISNHRRCTV
jgi:hypothetical protein